MLSRKDSRTVLTRCGLLFAAAILSYALVCCAWDTYLTLSQASRLETAARVQDILSGMADRSNSAAMTGNISMLDEIYDKSGYNSMAAYSSELQRINALRKWSGQRVLLVTSRTTVTVTQARRTVHGFTAAANYSTLYYFSSPDGASSGALEVCCRRELELIGDSSGYMIASDVYSIAPTARIYKEY